MKISRTRWSNHSTYDKAEQLTDDYGYFEARRVTEYKMNEHGRGAGYRFWADVLMGVALIADKESNDEDVDV